MENFNFAEFAIGGLNKRNSILNIHDFKLNGIRNECYRSIFLFDEKLKDFVDKTKTVTGYSGLHLSDGLSFDFDSDNLPDVKAETAKFCLYLYHSFEIPLEYLRVAFSGNKGFHVTIPFMVITDKLEPKDNFYLIYKNIAMEISAGFKFIDNSIYESKRLFRLLNTINSKSGLYKIPLTFEELDGLTVNEIKQIAKTSRKIDSLPISEMTIINPLKELYDKWNNYNFGKPGKTAITNTNIRDELLSLITSGTDEGNRHHALIRLTGLFAEKGFDYDFTLEMLKLWNKNNIPSLPDNRIEAESLQVYKDCQKNQKQTESIPIYSLKQAGEVYKDYISKISKYKIATGYKAIDNKLRGMMPGETMCILGKTSVGKSAFLQNIGLNFAKESKEPVLFYSMEMPITSVYERTFQIETGLSGFEVENSYTHESEDIKIKANIIFDDLPNFFTITESGMTLEQIGGLTKFAESNIYHKKTGLILIDYLSLVKENGKDLYEQTSRIARGIKDLAKKLDCPIIYLSQVTKKYSEFDELEINSARDSGSVDEASDFVLALWKDKPIEGEKEITLNLGILKNRKGGLGKIKVSMDKRSLKIIESESKGTSNNKTPEHSELEFTKGTIS